MNIFKTLHNALTNRSRRASNHLKRSTGPAPTADTRQCRRFRLRVSAYQTTNGPTRWDRRHAARAFAAAEFKRIRAAEIEAIEKEVTAQL